jgi:PAS domain S-box-containing protein
LITRDANRDQLTEWLTPEYEVVLPEDDTGTPEVDPWDVDLCIVDEGMLETHRDRLDALKQRVDPVFLPYLLVSPAQRDATTDAGVWDVVDEVVNVPTETEAFRNRLANLLRRRELSLELADDRDRQRALFRNIFESSNDAILVIDPNEGAIRECNRRAREMLGYSREELLSLSVCDIHPEETAAFRVFAERVAEDGTGWTEELTCRTDGGERLEAEVSASAIDIDGETQVLASVRDVTRRTEQRRVLDSLHDVTAELMRAETKRDVAEVTVDAAREVFDYDIAGMRLLDEGAEPGPTQRPDALELVAATDETYERLETAPTAYERGEGPVGDAFERGEPTVIDDLREEPVPFDYGPIRSVMCFPLDDHGVLSIGATEPAAFDRDEFDPVEILATNATAALTRAGREQALSERSEYLGSLFENTTDCIADVKFVDGAPRVREVNSRFEQVFGYDSEAIRGESLEELVVPPAERANSRSLTEHARAGNRIETEAPRETAAGRREFFIRVVPVREDGRSIGAYVVYTDITDRKRRDQQLQVLDRVLRHNIRNNLTVVQGTIEQVLADGESVPDSLVENALGATNDLLDLSETVRELSQSTRPDENPDPVSVARLVEVTCEALAEEYPDATITSRLRSDGHVAGTVQLGRAVRELCENAIAHTDDPNPSVTVTVEERADPAGWLRIRVADDGPGIPREQRAVLEEGEESQLRHGNGLGLWAVQWIVTSAGGELALGDPDEPGATVSLSVPTVEPDARPGRETDVFPTDE